MQGRAAWVTGIPLAWDVVVTLTASWQKVFSSDPRLGFFAQRDRYATALQDGEILAPAKSLDDMRAVITNSTVDGVLAAFFAVLVLVILVDATRVCVKAVRSGGLPTTETPYEPSRIAVASAAPPEQRPLAAAMTGSDPRS